MLADHTADPRLVAIDLLCQAEHGPNSPAVLVTTDPELADQVDTEIERLLDRLDRRDILGRALAEHGLTVIADNHDEAVAFAQEYAGEHVTILTWTRGRTPRPSPPPDRSMSALGRRSPPATMPPVPTTSSPPAASPPHTARSR